MNQRNLSRLAVMLACAFMAVAIQLSSSANAKGRVVSAQSDINCAAPVTSPPTGPAIVSARSTPYGRVLVEGSADFAGCSLYILTSDELHALTSGAAPFACSNNENPLGAPCDTVLWPALLTDGAPVAGPGVNPTLLGTVTRTDVLPGVPVQQVTYAGLPLYRFTFDAAPGDTQGANLFDPVTTPTGIWYLVEPSRGRIAPGRARLVLESAPVDGTGPEQTVLAVTMNNDFSVAPDVNFPVYTLSTDSHKGPVKSACTGICAAVPWPPVLTSKRPEAGPGVDPHAIGIIVRPDGTHQVTYNGKPLYLFFEDAYIPGIVGMEGIFGAGAVTPFGVFNTVPPLP